MASSTLYDGTLPSSLTGPGRTGPQPDTRWSPNGLRSGRSTILGFLNGLAEGWRAYRRWQELDSMSDRQLGRIGLDRRDIAHAAVFGPTATGAR